MRRAMSERDSNKGKPGIIYVLVNEAMPGYVKIGKTNNLKKRIKDLDTTSVPLSFICSYACTVKDMDFVEKQLHDAFEDNRVRSNREFFLIASERVVSILKLVEIEDVTPPKNIVANDEDQRALDEARKRRPAFNFGMVNIPIGSELSYAKDENIKIKVIDNKRVEYKGEKTSLSAVAQKLLGYDSVSGTLHWRYEGEILEARRKRFESQE